MQQFFYTKPKQPRFESTIMIKNDDKNLKTFIRDYFQKKQIGANIQKVLYNGNNATKVTMETIANHDVLTTEQQAFIDTLDNNFQGLEFDGWEYKHSDSRWRAARINKTDSTCESREDSSGKNSNCGEIFPDDSASGMGSRTASIIGHLNRAGVVSGSVQQNIVNVIYKDRSQAFNVNTCVNWNHFVSNVQRGKELNIPRDITKIYHCLSDGGYSRVDSLDLLKDGEKYIVETDEVKVIQTTTFSEEMKKFFDKLKTEQELDDDEIEIIKKVFKDERIKFKQLKTLTDEKLEKCGIKQLGLREAIVALI